MRHAILPLVLLTGLLAACGDGNPTRGAAPVQDTPEATFEAFRKASVAGDWATVYGLHLPSERAQAEAQWKRVRADSTRHSGLLLLAEKTGLSVEQLATVELGELFAKARTGEMALGGPELLERVKHSTPLRVEPVEGEEDTVILKFQFGPVELGMPLKREGARWWAYRSLEALVDI